ncbi:MAG: hypothetical protein ACYDBH_19055 [Acidobacteriaceae bacterium]
MKKNPVEMKMNARDDFPVAVKRDLAQRVNCRCSNPTCGTPTSGPTADPANHLNIGVAAHITAAAPGGPRYDANLTEEQRRSHENGIWLCQNCGKLNDDDPDRFSELVLRHWKQSAEAYALEQIGKLSPFDRTNAPKLEVLSMCNGQPPFSVALSTPTATLIQTIRGLFSDYFQDIEQTKLLNSGVGAFGRPYVILGLASNHSCDWSVLFFAGGEFGWELVARTRLESQKGYVPEALYVPGIPGALALTHVAGWGTGVLRRSTSWYRIERGELIPLLSYPHNFHVAGWGMPFRRELTTTLLKVPAELTQGALLVLRFEIEYGMMYEFTEDRCNSDLFSIIEILSLEWSEKVQKFVPRTVKDDFAKIEDFWNEGTKEFVERNMSLLQELAQVGTARQRQFIKEHLLH